MLGIVYKRDWQCVPSAFLSLIHELLGGGYHTLFVVVPALVPPPEGAVLIRVVLTTDR